MTLTNRILGALACMATALAFLSALAFSSGCQDESGVPGSTRRAAAAGAKATASTSAVDPRTQFDLSRALDDVETLDMNGMAVGYEKIRASWEGKRYRWHVRVVPALCRREACNVLPFELADRQRGAVHGWMPGLELDETAYAAIEKSCAGQSSCPIDIEGTLSKLVVDTENPTSLEFSDVRVL